jgi:hypothetical protein
MTPDLKKYFSHIKMTPVLQKLFQLCESNSPPWWLQPHRSDSNPVLSFSDLSGVSPFSTNNNNDVPIYIDGSSRKCVWRIESFVFTITFSVCL